MNRIKLLIVAALGVVVTAGAGMLSQPAQAAVPTRAMNACTNTHCVGTQSCMFSTNYQCAINSTGTACTITDCSAGTDTTKKTSQPTEI